MRRLNLEKKFGSRKLDMGAIPYGNRFGYQDQQEMTLKNAIQYALRQYPQPAHGSVNGSAIPQYVFERDNAQQALPEVIEQVPAMPQFLPAGGAGAVVPQAVQMYLGGVGSGAPPHFHGDAWNALMYGEKRWFLFHPSQAVFSRSPVSVWFREQYQRVKHLVHEVVQQPCDVMFVPKGWGHAVLNLRPSIGVAREFDSAFSRY